MDLQVITESYFIFGFSLMFAGLKAQNLSQVFERNLIKLFYQRSLMWLKIVGGNIPVSLA